MFYDLKVCAVFENQLDPKGAVVTVAPLGTVSNLHVGSMTAESVALKWFAQSSSFEVVRLIID